MKFAFLPNYFKKIGIIGFFAFFAVIIVSTIMALIDSYQEIMLSRPHGSFVDGLELGREIGERFVMTNYWIPKLGGVLLLLSIACYMLAKEKIDDEYIDAMRWDSLRLSIIICIGITILFIVFTPWQIAAKTLLFIQFVAYLIIFKIKKSRILKG
ncbi:MAG: hypothetical protein LBH91_08420 [Prevotellaceae bacterium]|jgi:hypothetical protein|nr:hypothetical protein [Prevotellaceae bacterium]